MPSKKTNRTVEPTANDKHLLTNDYRLVTERRTLMRQSKIEEIRNQCLEELELCCFEEREKMKRLSTLETELNDEIRDTMAFLDQTMNYYDEVLKQYTPPEEKSVEDIVQEIEGEFRKVYDTFAAGFDFDTNLPEESKKASDKEDISQKEINEMELTIEKNSEEEKKLIREVSQLTADIEKEKVKFTAHKLRKDVENAQLQRDIELLENKIKILQQPSKAKLEMSEILVDISRLREEIEKVTTAIRSVEDKIKNLCE